MKTRIEKVNIYLDEDVMLVAPTQEMYDFVIFMAVMAGEASEYERKEGYFNNANRYEEVRKQFYAIKKNIEEEEEKQNV